MKNIIFKVCKTAHEVKTIVYMEDHIICEYICLHKKIFNELGAELLKTTLLSWATLDFSIVDNIIISSDLNQFEQTYIAEQYDYCTKAYKEIYKYKKAEIIYTSIYNKGYAIVSMQESYYLGYSGGKDSTLCKELIQRTGKNTKYYKVSYDNDVPAEDGHIYCKIVNEKLYNMLTITGLKAESDIISCQQADDIHVTFACPYTSENKYYSKYLAVGIPWDAIHDFTDGYPDLVPTETYKSINILENLIRNYGFSEFKIISPIATLHTYGVYGALENMLGIEKLKSLDSCWESYAHDGNACGYCPKCQRIKKVFSDCFNYNISPDIPELEIRSADFLFGSIYATQLLKTMEPKKVMKSMLVDKYSKTFSGEFFQILEKQFELDIEKGISFEFSKDEQTWDEIHSYIVKLIKINYSELSDEICNENDVPYLPFEKYYRWSRKNKVLNCYNVIKWEDSINGKIKEMNLSHGNLKVSLPNNKLFQAFILNSTFFKLQT